MAKICMWDIVQVKGFTDTMIVQSVLDDYCVVVDKDHIPYKVKYEDITVIEYKPLLSYEERIKVIDNLIIEKAEEVFNNTYPKEIRCSNKLFEDGLFKKGFIEGYKKCEEDRNNDNDKNNDKVKVKVIKNF